MDQSLLISLIKEFGYFSMFLFNWLLIFGVPIPNEVAAAVSGMMTEVAGFRVVPAFLTAYAGLITSTTFAYFIGYRWGERSLRRLRKTFLQRTIDQFGLFLEQRGKWAISASFFLPGIRWAMPYVVGSNRFPLKSFIVNAYPAAFLWMLIYFSIGRAFPSAYHYILERIQPFLISISIILFGAILYWTIRKIRIEKITNEPYTKHRYGKKG